MKQSLSTVNSVVGKSACFGRSSCLGAIPPDQESIQHRSYHHVNHRSISGIIGSIFVRLMPIKESARFFLPSNLMMGIKKKPLAITV